MIWRPNKTLGAVIGMVMLIIILFTALFLSLSSLQQEPGLSAFATFLLALAAFILLSLWIYWYSGLWQLSYTLSQNALTINTGANRHVIPLDTIKIVTTGDNVRQKEGFRGIGWPGYLSGSIELENLGTLTVCSTEPLDHQLVLVTERGVYGISPANPRHFVADLQFKREIGVSDHVTEIHQRTGIAAREIWSDSAFRSLTFAAILINLVLTALLSLSFADIPARVTLLSSFSNLNGNIIPRENLFLLPRIGSALVVLNTLIGVVIHSNRRFGSHIAATVSVIAQAPLLIALLRIMGQA